MTFTGMRRFSVPAFIAILVACALPSNAADNVILFIGDGMGWEHVRAGRVLVNGSSQEPLSFETLGVTAECITTLPNGGITDSATAATALATGYQAPVNGVISMGPDQSIEPTVLELAKARGLRTGIITTDDIGGATPGAFGAHEPSRSYLMQIREDYLVDDTIYGHAASRPYLLLGGGYDDPTPLRGTTLSLAGVADALGYLYVRTASELASAPSQPLVGLFGTSWAPMAPMVSRPSTQPRLSEMVATGLSLLENPNGLFLMVESANIDKLSHGNDSSFVWEVAELEIAVQSAVAWRNSHPADHTLILVTADHETGGLSVPDQTLPPGTVPSMTWSTSGHTAVNVPIFATWPGSLNGSVVDNTRIFLLMEEYLNLSVERKPSEVTGLTVAGTSTIGISARYPWRR